MKGKLIIIFFNFSWIIFPKCVYGQIPNSGFENWTDTVPDGWFTQTGGSGQQYYWETPSFFSHSGKYALRSEIILTYVNFNTQTPVCGFAYTGMPQNNFYIPITSRPICLQGWYVLNNFGYSDTLYADITLKSNNAVVGRGQFYTNVTSTNYKAFTAPINYNSSAAPDQFNISFSFNQHRQGPQLHPGSYFLIDDLDLPSLTGFNKNNLDGTQIVVSPNPVSNLLQITSGPQSLYSFKELILYDALGKKINPFEVCSFSKQVFDISSYPSGIYILQALTNDGEVFSQKIIKE